MKMTNSEVCGDVVGGLVSVPHEPQALKCGNHDMQSACLS